MAVKLIDEGVNDSNAPLERFLGSNLLLYGAAGNFGSDSDIQYVRIRLSSADKVVSMRTWITDVPTAGGSPKTIRMGLYDQTDPVDPTLEPNARVAQTAAITITTADGLKFNTTALVAEYQVPVTGWYWVALISSHASVEFRATGVFPGVFVPIREESGTGDTLPATATPSTVETAAIYVAGVVEGSV